MSKEKDVGKNEHCSISRRQFVGNIVAGLGAAVLSTNFMVNPAYRIKAIAFDAFPIFDPRPVYDAIEKMYPGKGTQLGNVWRSKQFGYSWLRVASGQYKNFWEITEDALVFAAKETGVMLPTANRKHLMEQFLTLKIWPDVLPALQVLNQSGIRIVFLSNMTSLMLHSCIKHNKIEEYFTSVISTDDLKTFKPSPIAYQMGIDTLKLRKDEILFAAFAGWDASGSKWFGYPTFWVNRLGSPTEELDSIPDGIGKGMADLVDFVTNY